MVDIIYHSINIEQLIYGECVIRRNYSFKSLLFFEHCLLLEFVSLNINHLTNI